jgi:hypothetical protein
MALISPLRATACRPRVAVTVYAENMTAADLMAQIIRAFCGLEKNIRQRISMSLSPPCLALEFILNARRALVWGAGRFYRG